MAHSYTPGLRVAENTVVRKERRLPLLGEVLVKVGDRLPAETIVAKTELPGKVQTLNAANVLGIEPDQIEQCLIVKPGDPVCALVTGGGYSDYVIARAGSTLPAPEGIDLIAAAGLPETVFTVWANVFQAGQLKAGEILLVHGGSGGIGTTAIQMGKAAGARVFATAGSADKCALCERLGAERAINYREEDFAEIIKEAGGANVILDMVGGPYVQKNIDCAAFRGRIVQIAFLQGSRIEADLMRLMLKQLTLTGSTLRARPDAEKAELAKAIEKTVWPWIAKGQFTPEIFRTFPLSQAAEAHRLMEAGGHSGKIMLTP